MPLAHQSWLARQRWFVCWDFHPERTRRCLDAHLLVQLWCQLLARMAAAGAVLLPARLLHTHAKCIVRRLSRVCATSSVTGWARLGAWLLDQQPTNLGGRFIILMPRHVALYGLFMHVTALLF